MTEPIVSSATSSSDLDEEEILFVSGDLLKLRKKHVALFKVTQKFAKKAWHALQFGKLEDLEGVRNTLNWDRGYGRFYADVRGHCMETTHLTHNDQMLCEAMDIEAKMMAMNMLHQHNIMVSALGKLDTEKHAKAIERHAGVVTKIDAACKLEGWYICRGGLKDVYLGSELPNLSASALTSLGRKVNEDWEVPAASVVQDNWREPLARGFSSYEHTWYLEEAIKTGKSWMAPGLSTLSH